MSQVASLANVVQINLAMSFCLSFEGVPYYERSQELCSFIDSVVDKQHPDVAGQHRESHQDALSCGVLKRMYLMCDMVPSSRNQIERMKYVNLAKFPGWSVTQNGVTQTTGSGKNFDVTQTTGLQNLDPARLDSLCQLHCCP